ncbi:MAG: isopenicillin N synthase family oxygenase [Deltaproteobacteria bacterium]|nr:isopenicillin N synthase family oxygenase [Deltaproteobacteria bacterium]
MSPTTQTIPVASLRDFTDGTPAQRAAFVQTIGDALVDIGFFALEDHGVDQAVVSSAYEIAQAFFDQPEAVKLAYEDPAVHGQRGYTSFGREHAKDSAAPDLKEFWHVGREDTSDPLGMLLPWHNIWPTELPDFRPRMLNLYRQIDAASVHLLTACSIYLGETPEYLPSIAAYGDTVLRIIHYPPVPADRHPQAVRAAAHEDINLITLLVEATAGGLELLQRDGSWRPIHALRDQIVVDSGDMLQQLTNGFFKATTHRVVNPDNSRERRFSMPFFVHPRPEVDLTPRATAVQKTGGVATFPQVTAGEYLRQRLAEIGLM